MPLPSQQTLFILDESGDLGWSFNQPFRSGGSSRHLTIAALIVPSDKKQLPKRIIREMHAQFEWAPTTEVKASEFDKEQCEAFAGKIQKLLKANPEILIKAITVKKEKVENHIRADGNKLYNYMTKLLIGDDLAGCQTALLIPDKRSIKVESGHSLLDYLAIDQWFDRQSKVQLKWHPQESHSNLNIRVADAVAHIVFSFYEDGIDEGFSALKAVGAIDKTLFF